MKVLVWSLLLTTGFLAAQTTNLEVELAFEQDLIPEGIAIDPVSNKVFLNSLRWSKIVSCNLDGSDNSNFIQNREYGYLPGFGMTIKGDTLYALGNTLPQPKNKSVLLLLSITTGKLIKSYSLKDAGFAYLNDLAIGPNGDIFITDSESDKIYTIDKNKDTLEVFVTHPELKHCNGIAISSDGGSLFFASYTSGIRIMDIASKKLVNLPNNFKGIDGLKFYKNSLVAIVNGKRDRLQNGVYQFHLNIDRTKIEREEKIWDVQHDTDIPTTFAIHEDSMYFVADSQLRNLDQDDNTIIDPNKLKNYTLIRKSLLPAVSLKNYCTEIGRFDLLFDADEIAGAYMLKHKNALGGIWGKLEGNIMTGRWIDADGTGDIIITFSDNFAFFTADYRGDDEPDKWYRDSWHGSLRPDDSKSFEFNTKTYTCE